MSERHGVFIAVTLDDSVAADPETARKLEEVCPVDIFRATERGGEVVEENVDECVLCELCIRATPKGGVRIEKLYDGTVLGD